MTITGNYPGDGVDEQFSEMCADCLGGSVEAEAFGSDARTAIMADPEAAHNEEATMG